jgi:hypothetical protein
MYDIALDGKLLSDIINSKTALWNILLKSLTRRILGKCYLGYMFSTKRLLLDIYHDVSAELLQYYLDEFCYKFNLRYFGDKLFDRLVVAAVPFRPDFKHRIYNRA